LPHICLHTEWNALVLLAFFFIMMSNKQQIQVMWVDITILKTTELDYISLTDMVKVKDGDFFISDWLRNRNTIEFLWIWEEVNNPNFNYGGFAIIKSKAWLNNYKISVKEWTKKTNVFTLSPDPWTPTDRGIFFLYWKRKEDRYSGRNVYWYSQCSEVFREDSNFKLI